MSARRLVALAFAVGGWGALLPGYAFAQVCSVDETVNGCWARLSGASLDGSDAGPSNEDLSAAVKTRVEAEAEEDAKTANAGVDTAAAGTASATKNFIPLLRFAGLVGDGITTEDGLVAFDVNFPLPTPRSDDAQFQIVLNPAPTLHETLGSAIDTLGDAALREELEGTLSDDDDLRLTFTYGKKGDHLGRDFEQYTKVFSSLVDGALSDAAQRNDYATEFANLVAATLPEIQRTSPDALPEDATELDELRFSAIVDADVRARFMAGVATAALKQRDTEIFLESQVSARQLHRFADLVANQPQLYVSIERRLGSELTGAQRTSVELTWERGLVSLADFDREAPEDCEQEDLANVAVAPAQCVDAYSAFVTNNLVGIDSAGRSALSLRYSKVDRYAFSRPLNGIDVTVPSAEKLAASFTFGRKFAAAERGEVLGGDARMDFIVKYEHSDDETVLNSRAIAGLTFSRKVGDSVLPVTLLYSNKGELAGDSGAQISVNFGLAFELIR